MNDHTGVPRPVTVSIVLHGQWPLVLPLLEALQRYCAPLIDQVVLTVNKPEPAVDTGWLSLPVRRIDNPAPRGFGANHNAAFAYCRSPWFLVLNPDIRLDSDAIGALLSRDDGSGLVAPRVREPGKPGPEEFRDLLTPLELLRRRLPGHRPPAQPAWVPGMFMLLRASAFAQVHGFDERFHMYCEDFDLCARLRLAGWRLQVVQDVQVLHEAQRASNKSLRALAWHLESLARLWAGRTVWRYAALLRQGS